MSTPLTPLSASERDWLAKTLAGTPSPAATIGLRLLAERDSLERERDEAREQVRSLTVERDAARERGDRHNVTIGRVGADLAVVLGRLSRAREALNAIEEDGPKIPWTQEAAWTALRAALAEPMGGGP